MTIKSPTGVNLLLAVSSVTLTLFALEGAARFVLAREGPESGTEFTEYTEYNPVLGWSKRPGARVRFRRREYAVDVAINSHGLRDPERDYPLPPGTSRILGLGDSFVEGYGVPLEDTLTQVLEKALTKPACPAEVLNAGTAGYSTDQEYLFYETEGVRYSPRVVLLFFYYNDILFNGRPSYEGAPKPVFVYRTGNLELYKTPVPTAPPRSARGPERDPAESSLGIVRWLRSRLWFGAPRAYNALGRLGLWPPNRSTSPRMELRVFETREIPEIERAWRKTADLLKRLDGEATAHGAHLLVVYVPTRMEVSDRAWLLTRSTYGMQDGAWDRSRVLTRLQEVGRDGGIPILDLTPALRAADDGPLGPPYYPYDGHWNAVGHRVAAREVEARLRSTAWLAPCP